MAKIPLTTAGILAGIVAIALIIVASPLDDIAAALIINHYYQKHKAGLPPSM